MINMEPKITSKQLAYITLADLIFVSIWAITMILDMLTAGPLETSDQILDYISNPTLMFTITYFNATMLTIVTTMLFGGLYLYYKEKTNSPFLLIGILFIPVYSIMNIFAYGSQITIVPLLVTYLESAEFGSHTKFLLFQFSQNYNSIIAIINLTAYGILGIPVIIYSWFIYHEIGLYKKTTGIFLSLSGIFPIISMISLIFQSYELAGIFSITGGFFFNIALILLFLTFIKSK